MSSVGGYVFDTSSMIVWKNFYPDAFTSLWNKIDEAAASGMISSVREVLNELEQRSDSDAVLSWAHNNRHVFLIPSEEEQEAVVRILGVSHFQQMISQQAILKGTPVADPFVVAAALVRGRTVVTEELMKPNAAKIPNVCMHFGVRCINLAQFMAEQRWAF